MASCSAVKDFHAATPALKWSSNCSHTSAKNLYVEVSKSLGTHARARLTLIFGKFTSRICAQTRNVVLLPWQAATPIANLQLDNWKCPCKTKERKTYYHAQLVTGRRSEISVQKLQVFDFGSRHFSPLVPTSFRRRGTRPRTPKSTTAGCTVHRFGILYTPPEDIPTMNDGPPRWRSS